MKNLLIISFLVLLTSSTFAANKVVCITNSYSNGKTDGAITLELVNPSVYYNGKITLIGDKLIGHFENELKELRANLFFVGGGGQSTRAAEFRANVDLSRLTIFVGGRYEQGFTGFADFGGFKIKPTFDGKVKNKDWWFNTCRVE